MSNKHSLHVKRSEILLVTLYMGFLALIAHKIFSKETPLIWDAATHYIDSVRYYLSITRMDWKVLPYIDRYWPPLGHLLPFPIYVALGISPQKGIFGTNAVSIAIIVFALYRLSRYFGKRSSLIAVLVTLTSPIILDQSITFMIDLSLTAMTLITWYFLLKSEGFSNRRYLVLSAIFFGLGLLAKWTFIFFVAVPFLYELTIALDISTQNGEIRIRPSIGTLKHLVMFIGVVTLIAGWWYIPNMIPVIYSIIQNSRISGVIEGDPLVASTKSVLYYFFVMINFYLNPLLVGLLLMTIGLLITTLQKTSRHIKLVLVHLLVTYSIFTLTRNKDPRFMMPIVPFLGIILGYGWEHIKKVSKSTFLAPVFIALIILGCGINAATFAEIMPQTKISSIPELVTISGGNIYLSGYYWSFNLKTTEDDWHIREILSTLKADNKSNILVYVLSNNPVLTYPLRYRTITWAETVTVIRPNTHELIPGQFSADYILYTQSESYSARWEIKHSTLARKLFIKYNNITKAFVPVREFEFPDGTKGIIYKRLSKVPVPSNTTTGDVNVTCQQPGSIFGSQVKLKAICIYQMKGIYLLEYHWEALKDMDRDYSIFVHITDKNGNTVFQMDHKPCAGACPTSTWVAGRDVIEGYYLRFPLLGCYQIRLGLWDPQEKERLPVKGYEDGHSRAIVGRICQTHSVRMLPPAE